MDFTQTEK